jgi:hypothetical protein
MVPPNTIVIILYNFFIIIIYVFLNFKTFINIIDIGKPENKKFEEDKFSTLSNPI